MRKITLLSFFVLFSALSFGQTPCSPVSPLDCSEIVVPLPVDLDFNSASTNTVLDKNNLGIGFTAILENSETRRFGDILISDPNLNGYEPFLLTLNSGGLEILSQGGIAYLDPPASNNNNNQINTLGVGFDNLNETVIIKTTILNIVTGGGSAQAGIWFGYDEDNFVKLNVNDSNLELRVEANGLSANASDQIQQNLGASGKDVVLEMLIDRAALTAEAFYTIGSGARTSLGSLPISASYFSGRDINPIGGQDNISFAGIYATHRGGTQFTATFDEFSVAAVPAPAFEAHVNFQDDTASTTPPTGYAADYGLAYGASSLTAGSNTYIYGWKQFSNGSPIDVTGNGGAGRNRLGGGYASALPQEQLEGTLVHFQGDNISSWAGQNRGNELMWELQVPNGIYDVTVGLGDKGGAVDSRHSATVEGYTIIPALVPSSGQITIETMTVSVSDGSLTLNGVGGFNSKITHIDITESTGIPVNASLVFDPATLSPTLVTGTTGTFTSNLTGPGAATIALTIDDNADETGFNDWMNLPPAGLGLVSFNMDATDLAIGETRNSSIIATAKGFTPAFLTADFTVTAPSSTETGILTFTLVEQTSDATIGAGTIDIEVTNGSDLADLAPAITLSEGATVDPASGATTDFSSGSVDYTVTAEDGTTTQIWAVTITEAALPNQPPVVENQTFEVSEDATIGTPVGTVVATDADSTDLTYTITAGNDGSEFEIDAVSGEITTFASLNFEIIAQYTLTVEVGDGELTDTADIVIDVTEVLETLPFEAHVNFQDRATTPPSGYLADFGKGFGTASVSLGANSYAYGWKLRSDGTAIDVSDQAANNSNGAGRNRITGTYAGASLQEKLEGTLIHFQGDNIRNNNGTASWAGQPRGNELFWELEIPNGTYDVTIGLGDQGTDIDSRHSATVEGYTVVPAFVPSPNENRNATITVTVADGLLTVNGFGGFNSKINYIDVVESTGTPVAGVLSFDPAAIGETLEKGTDGTFSSTLSGAGATVIGLIIDDNINALDKNATGTNDWLTLPATAGIGQVDFAIDATDLLETDTRNNTIIATAQGFRPASLVVDLTVIAVPVVEIMAPYRMNVAGGETVKTGETFVAEDLAYLVERAGASETSSNPYSPNPGDTDLYFPRRFNADFGYAFPIPSGNYTVAVHMVENFFTTVGSRIFDVSAEGNVVVDNLDLVDSFGKGVLNIATFDVTVADNELNIDFFATENNGIVQAIEILPVAPTNETLVINEIMSNPEAVDDAAGEWFELYNPGTEDVNIEGWDIKDNDTDAHVISNGGPLLVPAVGYLVLGNNSDVRTNGGKIIGYQYSGITLANAGDEVVLVDDADNEVDRVEYDSSTFPNIEGASMALNALTDDNNDGGNWSAAVAAFGTGDLGTPGVSNEGKANESPVITSADALEVEENQTAAIDVETTDDQDSEGSGITYALNGGADDALFAIDADTGVITFLTAPDFDAPADDGADNIYNLQIAVTDSGALTAIQDIAITVTTVDESVAFEAHINFQNNPTSTPPPSGYLADYGKQFGNASVSVNSNAYQYGWKLLDTGNPFDASDEAANNSSGVGRLRLNNIGTYNSAPLQEKLEGTLVHFQGDNIAGWNDGQPRKNELFWELEIPNGTYAVTLGLGDKAADNIDSRHSATVEGYTIISAFSPTSTEVRTASMVVTVSDGLLTFNGLGGFNSKITHIDIVESTETPVNGALTFLPASASETLEAGANGSFLSELSGVGATEIGLVIDDNVDEMGNNDWLTLPTKTDLGQYNFTIDAAALATDDVRNDVIIATAKGFVPAILVADLTVTAGEPSTFAFIDDFDTYGTGNLHEIAPAQWLKERPGDAAIPVLAEGLTPNTTNSLDFSNGGHAHDLIPLTDNPVDLQADQPFYFGTYFKVKSAGTRVRTALRIDDDVAGDQWVREQVSTDGSGGLIARIGLAGAGSDAGNLAVDSDEVFQFVVRGEWDGENTISYSWTIEPKLAIEETIWTNAGTHTVQGTPQIGRLFISSANTNDARLGPVRLATDYSAVVTEVINTGVLELAFDVNALNFTGTVGEAIAPQMVTVSASSGNPTYVLSDDPDSGSWLTLPTEPVLGDIELGIQPDLPVGSYSTTLFASDQPDLGYANAEMTVSLEITEAVNDFAVNINFSDLATPAPADYEQDSGLPFGDRGNGLNYGWFQTDGVTPLNLSANARNRNFPALDIKQRTLIHMQYGDVGGNNGVLTEGLWEIEIPNGTYQVTVGAGDPTVDSDGTVPFHRINAEGINLIDNFGPTGTEGSATRFTSGFRTVSVSDGRLTIDALNGGFNTKINSIEIVAADGAVQTPRVVAVTPVDGATNVSVSPTISANDLFLPNLDTDGNAGVDNSTITNATVKLFKQGSTTQIGASVNGTGGGDAINLAPNLPLEANTVYVFEIDGVLDLVGEPFEFFTSSFTTGDGNTGPTTNLDDVSFTNSGVVASGSKYSTLTIGPDGKLYGLVISGDIHRWSINPDGSLANQETISVWKSAYGSRTSVGMVFDPAATASNLIAYVSHDSGGLNGAPDWDGKISRISGANLETEQLLVTDLPRSTKDHLTNSLTFRVGEPTVLYFNQGSNSAAGKPDGAWGNREESLLTAATLRLDLSKLPSTLPLNVHTTRDPTAINNVDVNSPTLGGQYNPYYVNAPLTLFATGIRNAYDLVWHSNGQLYVPTNGTAGGSNAPASIDGTRRPDGTFYNHSNPLYPIIPTSNGNNVQRDWLFRIDPTTDIGYYGHPNPFRGEFVLNRGDADVNNSAYNGVQADENYRGAAFDFEFNKSPNGVIEYRSDAENGNLKGALLVVRYSNLSDIIALVPDGPNGDIATFKEGIPGFGGFQDPLDLIEDVNTGNIYVSDYGRSEIVLLKPSNEAAPTPRIVLNTDAVTGDAVTNNTFTQEVLLSNLGNATLANIDAQLTGANADQFTIIGLPASINAQNSGSFNVLFTPTSNGPKFAQLVISGTNAESVTVPLSGLGKTGLGGSNEPSLQWILDTQLGNGVVNVGDTNPATNVINLPNGTTYNDIFGDEVAVQKFERAIDAPVTLELLSVYGPTANNPVTAFGWYPSGNAASTNELFTVSNAPQSNGQTLNAPITGVTEFDPGVQSFGFYSRWPFFNNRQLFSEDALNTFADAIPHHVRVYELPGEENAYIIATEEHISGFDYQDIVVIARNIRPFNDGPLVACSPISILECDELEVALPFALDFDGTEGGLSNTGFTMVDNPSARIAVDGPVSNPNVPGYEPGKLSFSNGNLIINANNGIAYVTNGPGAGTSSDVNSQINTLGVGIDANNYGSFSIETSIVNPYTDGSNDSEQAGVWFGLNEDNFVKFVANVSGGLELRKEVNGLSINGPADQLTMAVPNLNTSTVGLRLYVDVATSTLTAFYTLDGGAEAEMGSLPLPASYISGNAAYDNLSFAGIFATKRRELAAEVNYTFEDFAVTSDNVVVFEPVKINFSLPEDIPPTGYLVDSGLGFADRDNSYNYGWLTANGTTPLDLSERARNRSVNGVDILQNTLVHMQFQDVDPAGQEGIWEIEVPNGTYTVSVEVGDPNVDGQAGTEPFHSINVEGVNAIHRYSPTGAAGASTRFTSGTATATVTDGRLTIDASGGFNTKINSLEITQDGATSQPFFANVNPADNATDVAINDFQITVDVVVPVGYELDKTSLAGNVNLYEIVNGNEILVPSNSNDTGGGDAITLTPLSPVKAFTDYRFRLTSGIEANRFGDLNDRLPFTAFESDFTTGDEATLTPLDLTGVEFTKIAGGSALGEGTLDQRFSSLVVGPDGKLYASTIGDFASDGKIYRWDMAADGTLENLQILSPELQGAPHPVNGARNNNDRLIIGFAFDPAATANNLVAYITHSFASESAGPEWDGVLSRLSGPDLSVVEDLIIHLPRSSKDHLTNSIAFDPQGTMYINQGSNSAGGQPDGSWAFRPERLLSAAVLKLELNKLPSNLPFSAYTTDDIGIINAASTTSLTMSDGTYNPYAANAPLTLFSTGVRNAYDLVWHSNGWLYVPTNGTAGGANTPATADYPLARRIDELATIPAAPATNSNETQKDWLFKTQGGSYHGHPNPFRGEFILNHGGAPYGGVPGQQEASHRDVKKYPITLGPDPNYREPAYDFEFNKSPNGVIEYKSDAFGGKLQGLLMVVRFSGQDDLLVMQPEANGNIGNVNGDVPGLGGFDDPLDVVEDPETGNIYVSEYDRNGNGSPRLTLLRATVPATTGPEIAAAPKELIFEITVNNDGNNTDTKTVEVTNDGNEVLNVSSASITGSFADQFEAVQPAGAITVNPGESQIYTVTYAPVLDNGNLGYQEASLTITSDDAENPTFSVGLHALKKRGFEGGEEPALQDVVDALGIGIDVGWTSLTNGVDPNPVGDESEVELWIKANDAPINVTPVGRYSPGETLPFGWYTNDNGAITTNEVGILADGLSNAQTLFPPIASGNASFDPQGAVFGFYVESNTFNRLSYTEDAINALQTGGGVTHRTRIYPMADRDGNPLENSFLIAFEDASNGDYQDYMFIIDNVIPYEDGLLALNFDKEDVGFIASINQEDIPVQQVTLSGNGGITAAEIDLEASEAWVVLPDTYELDTSFDIGVDISGLSIGSYQATITASAPNYGEAVVDITLDVTNELIYTYQFNFQDPENLEISPEGYIDDIGVPYGVQNTANLGDLTFGWVLPNTLTPADASANGRNRNTGTNDDVLSKTFTIIGHRTAASFPTRDWMINVPNGTYSVNISVGGDPQYSDSNHVLDVNGVTVVDYDQQSIVPETFGNFENTRFVDVTDGTLRLALAAGGENAKVNYIRLAPIDVSLLPPTIIASFEGNESAPDTYRGTVDITLEATDNSDSGGIASLQYALDGNSGESYNQPISVGGEGPHTLVVTAEDNNGNVTEKTFDFTIEAPTGALLAIENMTKVPGTDRGFPSNDYYTFHRLGNPGQALVHDSNIMRLNNRGTGDLIVTEAIVSDTNDYVVQALDNTGAVATLPITIAAGSYAELDITFIGTTGNGNNGIFVENIEIVSNADNALENIAVLHGAYSPQPEGGDEINAQEVFDAFGFQSSMLSIVNDEGTITPPNNLSYRPSSNYPDAANIDAGYEGDMILSSTFVQADPLKPVIGIQLSALHGGPGSNGAKLVEVDGTGTVGGINFSHDSGYYQTLLPKKGANINFATANTINGPFRIAVSNYLSSGGNNINGNRPDLLGLRIYKVIDHDGNIIPNEYIVLQDFVQGGCGAGSANCDWNDNTFYFINIRPEGVPTAQPAETYLANVGEDLDFDIVQYFDKGYPGNNLTITASVANGGLPTWLTYNAIDGTLSGTPPVETTGSIEVDFDAVDTNGLTASTTLTIIINEPPVAVDDERTTTQNVAILIEDLLANDSEPNGQDIVITTVDTPQNGTAELQADGLSILYTPETDYVGSDSFTYTIEDESGLTASANVAITVSPENQAPDALIVTSINSGPAALFVEFTGSGSTDENPGTLQYVWNFGDGVGSSSDADTSYTFTSAGVFTVSLTLTDDGGLFDVATTEITVSAPPNSAPTAVASATPNNNNPLQFGFDGSGSSDTEGAVSYQWNFGDGNSSSEISPSHTYALAGSYDVNLTVTDEGDLTDSVTLQVVAEDSVTNDFALRINAGGPQVVHNGDTFSADSNFAGGKVYTNNNATVPVLYKTERSASPPTFAYNIPVLNGNYRIVLHFAEIYHGATGGGTGGDGKRVFDVTLEGNIVLNDYDINADVGPQTPVAKTFDVAIADGQLNLIFDAAGGDGVDQPKLSAIEVLGIDDPVVDCELPLAWTRSDVGAVAADGETCYDNGRFEVSASGADIWGSADEFHYVYQEMDGDGEIIAQVTSLDPTNVWAKAGVMMRNDIDANSAMAMMVIAPNPQSLGGPGHTFQHRATKGAAMGSANFTTPALISGGFPHYVRIVRSGNTFTGYISETEGNWTLIGSANILMNESIFVGLATTSHSDGALTNAVYENVSVTENVPQNTAPTAVATATPNGENPLQFSFDGSGSSDSQGVISYLWDFGDSNSSTEISPSHTYALAGPYDVTLTVTDEGGLSDSVTLQVVAEAPVTPDFALRINAGGPQLVYNGKTFSADQNFVGGKSYTNVNASLPDLYKTERSALPPNFGYEIPVNNGSYKVTLHFAELFWGATGGKPGGVGTRVFDVVMEGNTVLNDYDIIADVGSQTPVTKIFDVIVQDGTLSLALDAAGSDGKNEPKLSAIEIVSDGATNAAPTAMASANPLNGEAPLEIDFSSNGSNDDKGIVSYLWDFKDGTTSTDENPQHTFDIPNVYDVSLTVSDAEGETDEAVVTITVEEPVVNDFALRINAGGPQVVHNGETFSADTNFTGGKVYANTSATVPTLYKTERSALPPSFAYNVPVDNGNYQVTLHFAEIYWGATGGGTGGTGKRVFDVVLEGNTILNDYDINADVGPQSAAVKTFNVLVVDGVLNLVFDAAGSDGVDQPKVSAIEILGVGASKLDPVVYAGTDIEVTLPANGFTLIGSGSDPDGGSVSYQWTQVDGPDTALLTNENTADLTAEVLVEGSYVFRLTVIDDEGVSAFDEVTVSAIQGNREEVWLEAECAIVGSGWTTMNDGSQSGGQYLSPPSAFQSTPSNNASSIVSFDFSVTAGTYKIFGLVRTPSGTQDSFWVRVNGGPWVRWNSIPPSNNFVWHRIHLNEQLSQPRSFEFVEGVNRIDIGHREGGVGLDKLYVTQTNNIPTDLGGASTNCGEVNPLFDSNGIAGNSGNANKTMPAAYNDPIPNKVSMYPNAASSSTQITMSNPEAVITKLYVFDVSGRILRSYEGLELKTSAGAYLLQVSNLEDGVYLLRMVTTDGNVFDEKLLVRH